MRSYKKKQLLCTDSPFVRYLFYFFCFYSFDSMSLKIRWAFFRRFIFEAKIENQIDLEPEKCILFEFWILISRKKRREKKTCSTRIKINNCRNSFRGKQDQIENTHTQKSCFRPIQMMFEFWKVFLVFGLAFRWNHNKWKFHIKWKLLAL